MIFDVLYLRLLCLMIAIFTCAHRFSRPATTTASKAACNTSSPFSSVHSNTLFPTAPIRVATDVASSLSTTQSSDPESVANNTNGGQGKNTSSKECFNKGIHLDSTSSSDKRDAPENTTMAQKPAKDYTQVRPLVRPTESYLVATSGTTPMWMVKEPRLVSMTAWRPGGSQ